MRMLRESAKRRNAARRPVSKRALRESLGRSSAEERRSYNTCCLQAGSLLDATGKMPALQNLVPLALVFEHDFAEQPNGRHAVTEQFVMKFLQREIVALLRLVVVAQFQDLQFPKGVIQITLVKRGAHSFLARRLLFVVTVVLKEFGRFINRHVLRVHLDGHT